MERDNVNISHIYEKEKEYSFFKLIFEKNVDGIIEKEFKEYKLKAYIDFQSYSANNKKIENVDTRENLVGIIRIPVIAVINNLISETIEISDGDYVVFDSKRFELVEVKTIRDELKHYYSFYLTDYIDNIKFDKYKTELNTIFYRIFKILDIEAVVYSSFFQNSYFKKINGPFLTYEITQIKEMSDFTTKKTEISKTDGIDLSFRSNRRYKMVIKLYDKGKVLNLDVILSKNEILKHIMQNLSYKMEFVAEFETQKLDMISENDTIINNEVTNEKIYSLEFTVDTFYSFETNYIENATINGILKNGG